jgi:hypothetical protein
LTLVRGGGRPSEDYRHDLHEGSKLGIEQLVTTAQNTLSHPVVAIGLGIAFGALLLLLSRGSFRLMTPDSGAAGLAIVGLLLLARLVVMALLLFAYWKWLPDGFVFFAAAAGLGFFAMYTYELVRYAGIGTASTRGGR